MSPLFPPLSSAACTVPRFREGKLAELIASPCMRRAGWLPRQQLLRNLTCRQRPVRIARHTERQPRTFLTARLGWTGRRLAQTLAGRKQPQRGVHMLHIRTPLTKFFLQADDPSEYLRAFLPQRANNMRLRHESLLFQEEQSKQVIVITGYSGRGACCVKPDSSRTTT